MKNFIILILCIYIGYLHHTYHNIKHKPITSEDVLKKINHNISNIPIPDKHFNFNFVQTSTENEIEDDMVMDDSNFKIKSAHYAKLINKIFTPHQLKGLREILIMNCAEFDANDTHELGECVYDNEDCYVMLAGYAYKSDVMLNEVLFHELCHVMQNSYMDEFNKIKDEWIKYDELYVSNYAETDIDEDFAETGAHYLLGQSHSNNPKFKLFEKFFNSIK